MPRPRTLLASAAASLCWLGCSAARPASSTAYRDEVERREAALAVGAELAEPDVAMLELVVQLPHRETTTAHFECKMRQHSAKLHQRAR